jgi:ankyrin repeat protein
MLLLDYDSTVETIDVQDLPTGRTCLHWAVLHHSTSLVDRLIQLGANVNIRDREWNTPFMVAVTCRHDDIVAILVS